MKRFTRIARVDRFIDDPKDPNECVKNPSWAQLEEGTFVAPDGWRVIGISHEVHLPDPHIVLLFESDDPVPTSDQPYR